jgi:LysM repeat protein
MKPTKILRLFKPKKVLTATARRASAATAGMEFEGIPEPNMKLSRALLIVLLLHVVAVSGIVAFNAIKTRERSLGPEVAAETANEQAETAATATHEDSNKPRSAEAQKENARHDEGKPSRLATKEEHATAPLSSGKIYIVKKGDKPITIARRLKVSYDDLMALNHIDNPRRLQIGQKLLIPKASHPTRGTKKNKK